MNKCKKCGYLMEPDHVCPTPEEIKTTQNLIGSAAKAVEQFSEDELERYASQQ